MTGSVPARPERERETPDIESSSEAYARRFAGEVGAWFLEIQTKSVLPLLSHLPTGARVLDVGGGHAQLAPALAAAGFNVTVLGSAPVCGNRLREIVRASRCRFEVGSLNRLPHADRSFDAVLAFRMLPHLQGWREFVGELCRVARSTIVLDYPSRRSVNVFAPSFFGLKKRVERDTRPFTLFRPAEVAAELRHHGFSTVALRPQFLFPMALHRLHSSAVLGRALEAPGRLLGLTRVYGSPVVLRADSLDELSRSPDSSSRRSTAS